MTALIFSAYNASAKDLETDPEQEEAWYATLRAESSIGGLGLRFNGSLHPAGVARLAGLLDPRWSSIVSMIPLVLAKAPKDPHYGLASERAESRQEALSDVRRLWDQLRALHEVTGALSVQSVELHSAPRATEGASSVGRLAESLSEIASWDWGGVALQLEHCDALIAGQEPQKGFLRIDQEIEAVGAVADATGFSYGQSLNWGRSAIESRSSEGPIDHINALRKAGTLSGLIFSGASPQSSRFAGPWQDSHVPIADAEPSSLLTTEQIQRCLAAVGDTPLRFLGAKVGAPADAVTQQDRLSAALRTLHAVEQAASTAGITHS